MREQAEVDVVAGSLDKTAILVGECKWSERRQVFDVGVIDQRLREKARQIPATRGRRVITSCWLGGAAEAKGHVDRLVRAEEVMAALRRG